MTPFSDSDLAEPRRSARRSKKFFQITPAGEKALRDSSAVARKILKKLGWSRREQGMALIPLHFWAILFWLCYSR
jgi:hypothetical protein